MTNDDKKALAEAVDLLEQSEIPLYKACERIKALAEEYPPEDEVEDQEIEEQETEDNGRTLSFLVPFVAWFFISSFGTLGIWWEASPYVLGSSICL